MMPKGIQTTPAFMSVLILSSADIRSVIMLDYILLYQGLGEYSILIGCRVSINP